MTQQEKDMKLPFEVIDKYINGYTAIYKRIGEITDLDDDTKKIIADSIIFLIKDGWIQGMDGHVSIKYKFSDRRHMKDFLDLLVKHSDVLSDHITYEDVGQMMLPSDGDMVIRLKESSRNKKGYTTILDIDTHMEDRPTVTLRTSNKGMTLIKSIYWGKKKGASGKRIKIQKRYDSPSITSAIFNIIGPENIISWESLDFYGSSAAEFRYDSNDVYPTEGNFKALLEYESDHEEMKQGEFQLLLRTEHGIEDYIIFEMNAPSDAGKFCRELLGKIDSIALQTLNIEVSMDTTPNAELLYEVLDEFAISPVKTDTFSLYYEGGHLKPNSGEITIPTEDGDIHMSFRRKFGDFEVKITCPRAAQEISTKLLDKLTGGVPGPTYAFMDRPIKIKEVTRKDIGGLEEVITSLEDVMIYLTNPDAFKKLGIDHPKGALLYGPPGTGKTMLVKMIATETKASFIYARGSDLTSYLYGKEQQNLHNLFEMARKNKPALIFIDEIDTIAPKRDKSDNYMSRGINQLLTEIDGIEDLEGVVLLCATNRIDALDPALLRGGRIGKLIPVPVPDEKAREEIFRIHLKNVPLTKDIDFKALAKMSDGLTGADIKEICIQASLDKFKSLYSKNGYDNITDGDLMKFKVSMKDLERALHSWLDKPSKNAIVQQAIGEGLYA